MVDRRTLLTSLGAAAVAAMAAPARGRDSGGEAAAPVRNVVMLLYPEFFAQDLVGPYTVFASLLNTKVHLLARSRDLIKATPGVFPITPSGNLADCPSDVTLLFVPGGAFSTIRAMEDPETMAFVREVGGRARFVTSVCTGSLVLGAAGLLHGYRATSHWVVHDLLARFGAIPTAERVVEDRNRITGGGVTAGIDFGLKVAAVLDGTDTAELIQLAIEYDPKPPFDSGSPARAPAHINELARKNYAPFRAAMEDAVARFAG